MGRGQGMQMMRASSNFLSVGHVVRISAAVAAALVVASAATAQESATTQQAVPSPAREVQPLKAKVIEVTGSVEYASTDADPNDASAWKAVEKDMELSADTQIRTGLRSQCVLMFGEEPDETVIAIRRATLAAISDFHRTQTEQRVRLGLGYGAIRGGSTEGTLRSDVVIDSTVATLAKRGTEGYEIQVEPVSGAFRVSLARSGLVTALSKARNLERTVRVGEYVNNANVARMWVNQDIFDRAVRFAEVEAVTASDLNFNSRGRTGFANLAPGVGSEWREYAGRDGENTTGTHLLDQDDDARDRLQTLLIDTLAVNRAEGNFGFGPTLRVRAPQSELERIRRNPGDQMRIRSITRHLVESRPVLRSR